MISTLRLGLILTVILFSCVKKNRQKDPSNFNGVNAVSGIVVTAPEPQTSITSDLIVSGTGSEGRSKTYIVATQSEYNSMDYKNRIFYSGLQNAIRYLTDDPANDSTVIQFNIDGTYSIETNPTKESGIAKQCNLCSAESARKCVRDIIAYLKANGFKSIGATIGFGGPNGDCLTITYGRSNLVYMPLNRFNNGGIQVEKYTPRITYSEAVRKSYLRIVGNWVTDQPYDPIGGGIITHPYSWSRQRLIDYIDLFNASSAHPVHTLQNSEVFQTQLLYYVYNGDLAGWY
jgi:hypothetical protein